MTYDVLGPAALDYFPCRYGTSKLTFRGPRRDLVAPYVAFLGGTVTFGKFIEQPFPLRVEHLTGVASVNFGQVNAGLDVFSKDPSILDAAQRAQVTVVEVLGAANMSNRFYSVHPRRNDRFLQAAAPLKRLYSDVDFSQFTFTQHMLRHLYKLDNERFNQLRLMLQKTWMRRMRRLVGQLSNEVVLVRIGGPDPSEEWVTRSERGPVFVEDEMLDRLAPSISAIVEIPLQKQIGRMNPEGMVFNLLEEKAAKAVPDPRVHMAAAQALCPVLDRLM